jgi:hypothetical protein
LEKQGMAWHTLGETSRIKRRGLSLERKKRQVSNLPLQGDFEVE